MNTVTKIFIVLLVIFSISFTVMSLSFSATIPDWKAQAESWRLKAQQVDTFNRNLIAAKVAEAAKASNERRLWSEQKESMTRELGEARRELEDNRDSLARSQGELASKDATIQKLTAELSIAQASATKAREHRNDLERRNIQVEKTSIDLQAALDERIATIIVLEQQTRQQEQAINLLKQERDNLLGRGARGQTARSDLESIMTTPTDRVRSATPARVASIRGHVRDVDGELATLSIGSEDGVLPNMVFIIYNHSGYMGDLQITDVEPRQSAGILKFVNGRIRPGDMAAEESSYTSMN